MDDELEVIKGGLVADPTGSVGADINDDEVHDVDEDIDGAGLAGSGKDKPVAAPRRVPVVKVGRKYRAEDFPEGNYVVYPTHGVGQVEGVEEVSVGGQSLSLLKITFMQERLSVRLPIQKINDMGLRPVSSTIEMQSALDALSKKKRVGRKMWSRRAQEYESKINSGDPVAVAEVVRDLFRRSSAAEQSFSERQLYRAALERFSRELAAVRAIDEEAAIKQVEDILEVAAA
ncbi:MAG: CarD family transcriptional regulator [Alphaproteobacteria bacterium]|nr:CarD family transcriptional regulator [Alphaproteobacteria bacterium]